MTEAAAKLEQLRREVLAGPMLFAHKLDLAAERMLLVRLGAEDFRAASFLDDRALTPTASGTWVRFDTMARALEAAPPQRPLHYIFHVGHAGSTLLSRMLEALAGVLALREPLPLRTLAEGYDALGALHALMDAPALAQLNATLTLLNSRGFPDTRAVVLKATSSVGRIAPQLLSAAPSAGAAYLYLRPEPFLATLLAGADSPIDLRGLGGERIRRLAHIGAAEAPQALHAMSRGQLAALAWTAETISMRRAVRDGGARIAAIDFDALLAAPAHTLADVCALFGLAAAPAEIEAVAAGPVFTRYAKAPDRPYSPQLRAEILAASRARNGDEIRAGLEWIEQYARRSAVAAETLNATTSGA